MYSSEPKNLWKIEIYTYFIGLDVFEEIKDFCKDICKNFSYWFFINWPPHGHIWNKTFKISPKVQPFHLIFCFLIHLQLYFKCSIFADRKFLSLSSNESFELDAILNIELFNFLIGMYVINYQSAIMNWNRYHTTFSAICITYALTLVIVQHEWALKNVRTCRSDFYLNGAQIAPSFGPFFFPDSSLVMRTFSVQTYSG